MQLGGYAAATSGCTLSSIATPGASLNKVNIRRVNSFLRFLLVNFWPLLPGSTWPEPK